jgi:hypothetical protein
VQKTTGTTAGRVRTIKSILGELPVSEKQARKLKLDANQKISPYLEECCLRASANVSYDHAAKDIQKYTGISISASTQKRIVQRHEFPEIECGQERAEISVDGGKVRLRTEKDKKQLFFVPKINQLLSWILKSCFIKNLIMLCG